MELTIEARFKIANDKIVILEIARIKNEVLKHTIRTEYEFKIINEKEYLRLAGQIVEISRMINGWIRYLTEKSHVS